MKLDHICRFIVIVACAFAAGIGAVVAALTIAHFAFPEKQGGASLRDVLSSSVVMPVAMYFAVIASSIGCLFAVPILWRTQLDKTLPVTTGATIVIGGVFGCAGPLGAIVALPVCAIVMMLCRAKWPSHAGGGSRQQGAFGGPQPRQG